MSKCLVCQQQWFDNGSGYLTKDFQFLEPDEKMEYVSGVPAGFFSVIKARLIFMEI